MSPSDRSADRACGGDVAAYALGALEPAEAEAFRAHLQTCDECRRELAELQRVVDVLPLAATQVQTPRRLRRRVLSEVRNDARVQDGESAPRRPNIFARLPRSALAVGTAVLIAAIVVGGIAISNSGNGARVVAAQVTGEHGSAKVAITNGHGQLILHRFSPPPQGKVYEVWFTRKGKRNPIPTGVLFSVSSSGDSNVNVGDVHGVKALLVTPEPSGGSSAPTHTPVISAELS